MATGLTGVIRCGVTNLDPRAESITRAMRADQGFRTDGGCDRAFDLASDLALVGLYRCVECARWLCHPCILAHFAETTTRRASAAPARGFPSTT